MKKVLQSQLRFKKGSLVRMGEKNLALVVKLHYN